MLKHAWKEEERDHIDDHGYESSPDHSSERIACDDSRWMYWCDEKLFDRFLEFSPKKWRRYIRIRIGDDSHKDDPWYEEGDIVSSSDLSDTRSDKSPENDKVERLSDDRWEDRLRPYTHDTYELFTDDSRKCRKLDIFHERDIG